MKKVFSSVVALFATVTIYAQEVCSFNANNVLNLAENGTVLQAGTVIGESQSIVAAIGVSGVYKPQALEATVNGNLVSGGLQGNTTPLDADGISPSVSMREPVSGSYLAFHAKADGWLYVIIQTYSDKAYTVFEEGAAIGYTFAAIGDSGPLPRVYTYTLIGDGEYNYLEKIGFKEIESAEKEYLRLNNPAEYRNRWVTQENGTTSWNGIETSGMGLLKFKVYKDCDYRVCAAGTSIKSAGFCFDTTNNIEIKKGSTTLFCKRTINVPSTGQLNELISADEKFKIDELTLTGSLNGTDFLFIREMAGINLDLLDTEYSPWQGVNDGRLRVLDLSGARAVAGGLAPYKMMISSADKRYHYEYLWDSDAFYCCLFSFCHKLEEIILPKGAKWIYADMFDDSDAWTGKPMMNINIMRVADGNETYDSRDYCNAVIKTATNTLVVGGSYSTIPNGITTIGERAFYECNEMSSLIIPSSVTSIEKNAFLGCGGLNTIVVEDGNTVYDSRDNCNAIIETYNDKLILGSTKTVIPNGVREIGPSAFKDLSGLKSIIIPESVTTIGTNAFNGCSGLTSIDIPGKLGVIADYAFRGCSSLRSLTIPEGITGIGSGSFYGCSSLTSVTLSNTLNTLGYSAFAHCSNITSVDLGNHLTTIDTQAFFGCNNLKAITIPASVATIKWNAFGGCKNLTTVIVEITNPISITNDMFPGAPNGTLYVPQGSKAAYSEATGWNRFAHIVELIEGDANGDGNYDFEDVNAIARYIFSQDTENFYFYNADLNKDGKVNIADIVLLINKLRKKA